MSDISEIRSSLLKRLPLAVGLFIGGFLVLMRAGGSHMQSLGIGLVGCGLLIAGAIILARPLAQLLAEPSGSLFWPGERFSRPVPMFSIPQARRACGFYEQAILEYEQIAADYPDLVEPYIEMIDISLVNLKDPERAEAIYHRGLAKLKKQRDQQTLTRLYSSRQKKPSENRKVTNVTDSQIAAGKQL